MENEKISSIVNRCFLNGGDYGQPMTSIFAEPLKTSDELDSWVDEHLPNNRDQIDLISFNEKNIYLPLILDLGLLVLLYTEGECSVRVIRKVFPNDLKHMVRDVCGFSLTECL